MKLNQSVERIDSAGLGEGNTFSIAASAKAFEILSSQLYSDGPLAVIRELFCNAVDAHASIGKGYSTVEVHVPTMLAPFYSVRDYGPGLSHNDILHLYTTFFSSSKDQDNKLIGGFGLGSKAPFAVAEEFSVTSWHGGMKRSYILYKDGGLPKVNLLSEEPSSEPAGLQVSVSPTNISISKWQSTARKFFEPMPIRPVFVGDYKGNNLDEFPKPILVSDKFLGSTRTPRWEIYAIDHDGVFDTARRNRRYNVSLNIGTRDHASYVRLGVVLYPIDRQLVNTNADVAIQNFIDNAAFILNLPIGSVEITPSREQLSYDKKTIATLTAAIRDIQSSLEAKIEADLKAQPDLESAYNFLDNLRLTSGIHYSLNTIQKKLGFTIVSTNLVGSTGNAFKSENTVFKWGGKTKLVSLPPLNSTILKNTLGLDIPGVDLTTTTCYGFEYPVSIFTNRAMNLSRRHFSRLKKSSNYSNELIELHSNRFYFIHTTPTLTTQEKDNIINYLYTKTCGLASKNDTFNYRHNFNLLVHANPTTIIEFFKAYGLSNYVLVSDVPVYVPPKVTRTGKGPALKVYYTSDANVEPNIHTIPDLKRRVHDSTSPKFDLTIPHYYITTYEGSPDNRKIYQMWHLYASALNFPLVESFFNSKNFITQKKIYGFSRAQMSRKFKSDLDAAGWIEFDEEIFNTIFDSTLGYQLGFEYCLVEFTKLAADRYSTKNLQRRLLSSYLCTTYFIEPYRMINTISGAKYKGSLLNSLFNTDAAYIVRLAELSSNYANTHLKSKLSLPATNSFVYNQTSLVILYLAGLFSFSSYKPAIVNDPLNFSFTNFNVHLTLDTQFVTNYIAGFDAAKKMCGDATDILLAKLPLLQYIDDPNLSTFTLHSSALTDLHTYLLNNLT